LNREKTEPALTAVKSREGFDLREDDHKGMTGTECLDGTSGLLINAHPALEY
jgi:hypothetical protein